MQVGSTPRASADCASTTIIWGIAWQHVKRASRPAKIRRLTHRRAWRQHRIHPTQRLHPHADRRHQRYPGTRRQYRRKLRVERASRLRIHRTALPLSLATNKAQQRPVDTINHHRCHATPPLPFREAARANWSARHASPATSRKWRACRVTAPSLHAAFWETTNAGSTSWSTPDTTADRPARIAHGGQGLHHQRWSHACGKRRFRRAAHLDDARREGAESRLARLHHNR